MPGLRNLERWLLRVEQQLAPPAETKVPVTVLRVALDQMDHADRQLLSELKGLTREQIRRRVSDDYEIRVGLRRAIGFAMRPTEQSAAGDDMQGDSLFR